MSSTTDQIKSRLDIVSVVGGYVKLEKSGSNFKARCPFHNEKTPSFFVSPDRGSYYCFGCQAKGDIFTFVQEFEGLDFSGALKVLAERAGVELQNFRPEEKSDKDGLFRVCEQATFYFEKNLSEQGDALDYLKSRGVTKETIAHFRLGLAFAEWRGLHDFLLSKNVGHGGVLSDMEHAGLIKRKEGGGFYDTFRSRIMFPLADSSGRIVAFSGRIWPNDPSAPKYLNSPETSIFRKSEVLYGLDKAKKDIHLRDYSILVEGQMDLIMLHQSGFTNTVASSGTALTQNHLIRLQRLSNRLIMAYDGDAAGFSAIARATDIALSLGMEVKVAGMKDGKDPADMALHDKEGLTQAIKDSKHIISFVLDGVIQTVSDARLIARKVVSDVLPFVARVQSASEQSHFIREITTKTGIKEDALWEDLRKVQNVKIKNQNVESEIKKEIRERGDVILKKLFGIIFWQTDKKENDVDSVALEKNMSDIIGSDKFSQAKEIYSPDREALVFETEMYYTDRDTVSSNIDELLANLHEETLKKELIEIGMFLHRAELAHDTLESTRLLEQYQKISYELNILKNKTIGQ